MSSRTRSTRRWRSDARAWRPFSANVIVCPSCSRARPSSSRFTRLSSTTRRLPACGLRREATSELFERAGGALALAGEGLEPLAGSLEAPAAGHGLQLPCQGRQPGGAERLAVGLQRVGGPAEGVEVGLAEAASQRGHELAAVVDERVDQLGDERAAHR